jgi:hypothetical protein
MHSNLPYNIFKLLTKFWNFSKTVITDFHTSYISTFLFWAYIPSWLHPLVLWVSNLQILIFYYGINMCFTLIYVSWPSPPSFTVHASAAKLKWVPLIAYYSTVCLSSRFHAASQGDLQLTVLICEKILYQVYWLSLMSSVWWIKLLMSQELTFWVHRISSRH